MTILYRTKLGSFAYSVLCVWFIEPYWSHHFPSFGSFFDRITVSITGIPTQGGSNVKCLRAVPKTARLVGPLGIAWNGMQDSYNFYIWTNYLRIKTSAIHNSGQIFYEMAQSHYSGPVKIHKNLWKKRKQGGPNNILLPSTYRRIDCSLTRPWNVDSTLLRTWPTCRV